MGCSANEKDYGISADIKAMQRAVPPQRRAVVAFMGFKDGSTSCTACTFSLVPASNGSTGFSSSVTMKRIMAGAGFLEEVISQVLVIVIYEYLLICAVKLIWGKLVSATPSPYTVPAASSLCIPGPIAG